MALRAKVTRRWFGAPAELAFRCEQCGAAIAAGRGQVAHGCLSLPGHYCSPRCRAAAWREQDDPPRPSNRPRPKDPRETAPLPFGEGDDQASERECVAGQPAPPPAHTED